jgi:thymidylate synthase (FAD)
MLNQSVEILDEIDGEAILKKIEKCGRICYKSEEYIDENSCYGFVQKILDRKHESVLEHVNVTVKFVTDRAIANEIVRHRIASYSQESTRYCNYDGKGHAIIEPSTSDLSEDAIEWMLILAKKAQETYDALIQEGVSPQYARDILPLGLTKTELVMTANLREWRHFFKMRTSHGAHPKMQRLAKDLLYQFNCRIPLIFEDIANNMDSK